MRTSKEIAAEVRQLIKAEAPSLFTEERLTRAVIRELLETDPEFKPVVVAWLEVQAYIHPLSNTDLTDRLGAVDTFMDAAAEAADRMRQIADQYEEQAA